jgi:hypothetical protein
MCTNCQPRAGYTSSRDKFLGFRVFVTLMFEMVCTVLYPTYWTGTVCDWKPETSCTRHFTLHGSIPCHGQKFFNFPKAFRIVIWPYLPLIKGVSRASFRGYKQAVVKSEHLTTQSNFEVNNKWRYTTTPPNQSSRSHQKILNISVVT